MKLRDILYIPRWALTVIVGQALKLTRFRFSKDYRWGVSAYHRLVYRCICTFGSNIVADGGKWSFRVVVLGKQP